MIEKKTLAFDIETDLPLKLHDYQLKMIEHMAGFKTGDLALFTAGRQTGKSYVTQSYIKEWMEQMANRSQYELIKTATVDGEPWYVVRCNKDAASWIRAQNKRSWYEHTHAAKWQGLYSSFDINERLFIMLKVGFSV